MSYIDTLDNYADIVPDRMSENVKADDIFSKIANELDRMEE
jgi:hypothetical protein